MEKTTTTQKMMNDPFGMPPHPPTKTNISSVLQIPFPFVYSQQIEKGSGSTSWSSFTSLIYIFYKGREFSMYETEKKWLIFF